MNNLKIFNNEMFGKVRVENINGDAWFCLADVCKALEIKNASDLRQRLNEKGIDSIYTPTKGGKQQLLFINESNLYKVIFQSRKPSAEKFTEWITGEVIPSIRKTGSYGTPTTIKELAKNPDLVIEIAIELKKEQERNKVLEIKLDEHVNWCSIKKVNKLNGKSGLGKDTYDWRALKNVSNAMGYGIEKVFDENYGYVNAYHKSVWEIVYPDAKLNDDLLYDTKQNSNENGTTRYFDALTNDMEVINE